VRNGILLDCECRECATLTQHFGQMTTEKRDVLVSVAASLAAAISILERTPAAKKAAPSNTMFAQMLDDYRASLERARAYLRSPGETAQSEGT
jgi:hypothetical protein